MAIRLDGVYDPSVRYRKPDALQVILTRYSMALPWSAGWTRSRLAAWLDGRLEVFKEFCLPSVVKQIERPDLWLLGFERRHEDLVEPVMNAIKDHTWIVPVWQEGSNRVTEQPYQCFGHELRARLDGSFGRLITTRLDSDDAIHRSFIHHLGRYSTAVTEKHPELEDFWVSFPIGAHYHADSCRMFGNPTNHFLSRIQTVGQFQAHEQSTALFGNHSRVFQLGPVFLPITDEPMWLEIVHGRNIQNKKEASSLLKFRSANAVLSRFGIRPERGGQEARRPRKSSAWRRLRRTARHALRTWRVIPPKA